jgi:hypothetical protein
MRAPRNIRVEHVSVRAIIHLQLLYRTYVLDQHAEYEVARAVVNLESVLLAEDVLHVPFHRDQSGLRAELLRGHGVGAANPLMPFGVLF